MNLRARYRRLSFWNKVQFWGAVTAFVGLPLAFLPIALSVFSTHKADAGRNPISFSLADPKLRFVRLYDLRKDLGAKLQAGKCPEKPCFRIEVRNIDMRDNPPSLYLVISGTWGGNVMPDWHGISFSLPIKQGCHLELPSPEFDVKFEILEDRISSLRAWVAIFNGTASNQAPGRWSSECPR